MATEQRCRQRLSQANEVLGTIFSLKLAHTVLDAPTEQSDFDWRRGTELPHRSWKGWCKWTKTPAV